MERYLFFESDERGGEQCEVPYPTFGVTRPVLRAHTD